ncbi:MAG: hypothetical protein HKN82_10505 [Akkermansiaceae bacterium]|nr:hypothetical protein [Akkermansiaceae bacterium]
METAPAAKPADPAPAAKPVTWKRRLVHVLLLMLLIVGAGFAAHGLCLKNPFYLDDQAHILKSVRVHNADWFDKATKATGHRVIPYTVWIILHKSVGFKAPAFHAVNLTIHILTALATYFAAREFARLNEIKGLLAKTPIANSFAFWSAVIFVVHTLNSEVVNYASQATIAFMNLFLVLSVGALFRAINTAREWWLPVIASGDPPGTRSKLRLFGSLWWLLATFLATALAAVSKQPGIAHAVANLAIIAIVLCPWKSLPALARSLRMWRSPAATAVTISAGLILTASLGFIFYWMSNYGLFYFIKRIFNDPEMGWHLLTQARVFWSYLWRMFLPVRLCSDHWIPITQSTGDVGAWVGATGIVLLIAFNVYLFRRHRAYCMLLALTLAPLLARFLFRNQEPFVEYRTYPAMPWLAMLVTFFAGVTVVPRIRPRNFAIGATAVAAGLAALSAQRASTWNSARDLVADIRKKYPLHVRCQSYVQAIDFSQRKYHSVIDRQVQVRKTMGKIFAHNRESKHRKYIVARSLNSFMFCEQYNAYALIELKKPQKAIDRVTEVIDTLSQAINTDQGKAFAVLFRVRGKAHASLRQFDKAAADYRRALERMPTDLETPRLIMALPPQFRKAAVPVKE